MQFQAYFPLLIHVEPSIVSSGAGMYVLSTQNPNAITMTGQSLQSVYASIFTLPPPLSLPYQHIEPSNTLPSLSPYLGGLICHPACRPSGRVAAGGIADAWSLGFCPSLKLGRVCPFIFKLTPAHRCAGGSHILFPLEFVPSSLKLTPAHCCAGGVSTGIRPALYEGVRPTLFDI